jgi:fructose-1,6-bisphosphatase
MMGLAGSSNVQGEDQKKLDIVANEVFKNSLRRSGQCCILVGGGASICVGQLVSMPPASCLPVPAAS